MKTTDSSLKFPRLLPLTAAILWLSACASYDGLQPQASLLNTQQLPVKQSLDTAATKADWPQTVWWQSLGDAQLNRLIEEALAGSPSLKVAEARLRQTQALALGADANRWPQLDLNASSNRERSSENLGQGRTPGGQWHTLNSAQLNLTYELDFWNKNQAALESALGQVRAAEAETYASRLLLSVNVASAYIELARLYDQWQIAQDTLQQRQQILSLTQHRVDVGIDSEVDLKQAETAVPAAQELIAQLEGRIQLGRNQLAALLGQGPDRGLQIQRPNLHLNQNLALPANLSTDLMGRRPDVVAARWRVESASQDIRGAKAAFYPDIRLNLFAGLQSVGFDDFFQSGSRVAGFGPALSLPIFDAGRLRANLAVTDADFDLAVESYNQTLITALREVVDQWVSLQSVDRQDGHAQRALGSAQQAYDLARMRYEAGIDNYLQVLASETQLLNQKSLKADLEAQRLSLSVALIQALGGGFETPPMQNGAPAASATSSEPATPATHSTNTLTAQQG